MAGDAGLNNFGDPGTYVARVTMSAVVGGTASVLSGGKFANGAVTSAFATMYNDADHGDQASGGAAGVRGVQGSPSGPDYKSWYAEANGRAEPSSFLEDTAMLVGGAFAWVKKAFAGAALVDGIEVGGGASLRNLSEGQIQRIQNAADRYDRQITVIGSRALKSLPSGNPELTHPEAPSQVIKETLDKTRPYITFSPRGKQ